MDLSVARDVVHHADRSSAPSPAEVLAAATIVDLDGERSVPSAWLTAAALGAAAAVSPTVWVRVAATVAAALGLVAVWCRARDGAVFAAAYMSPGDVAPSCEVMDHTVRVLRSRAVVVFTVVFTWIWLSSPTALALSGGFVAGAAAMTVWRQMSALRAARRVLADGADQVWFDELVSVSRRRRAELTGGAR